MIKDVDLTRHISKDNFRAVCWSFSVSPIVTSQALSLGFIVQSYHRQLRLDHSRFAQITAAEAS